MPSNPHGTVREGRSLRVLVAEDNEVNQAVAARLLANRGHHAVIVSTGREALDAWERDGFDLILMDVQMPQMDGLAATAAIRLKEQGTARRTPIVALTANASPADEARCLGAGMDALIAKPVRVEAFYDVIARVLTPGNADANADAATAASTHAAVHDASRSDVFDVTAALEAVDGERELLHGMIGIFVRQTPRVMSDIDAALAAGDASALAMAAHKLKGSVAMFGAHAAREAAQRLEDLAEAADLAGAADARARLGEEVTRLHAALEALAAGDAR
jgi:two-component system sensor histidine kinase/response regulator